MTELKTLKDIVRHEWLGAVVTDSRISVEHLRAEAIKWHKHLEHRVEVEELLHDEVWQIDAVQRWIAEFFNLKEEELK